MKAMKEYLIQNNISPGIDFLKDFLSKGAGNDDFTQNQILGGVKSKNNFCTYEAYKEGNLVGLLTAWTSDFHPYCTYFSLATNPFLDNKAEALLLQSLYKTPGIRFPLQTLIWETSYRLKTFYEDNEFVEIRRTYMPMLKSSKIEINRVFADIASHKLTIKDLYSIKDNDLLKFKLTMLIKENYSRTHSKNPVGELDFLKWEKLIFNNETNQNGSYIALKDNEIIAYTLLHFSETPNRFEFGWRGTKNYTDIRVMLMLTALQVNFAAENGVDFIEAEIDTTDHFAIEMLKFFPFSSAPALLTFQKRENR
ncbi:GNAT family acetyltransferase [Mesobacillus jeotgali]|uniref:GNAT family acetyltransferase n=1 Tax=Mesobacillus jeotgali TaxID=129985 RepID=UPI00177D91A8|nr:GNAT family acetyltransferase [Mesobacillus jeotgali]UYZ24184.1 GNAT family acetyltransferase [Mesobacillus jeotgali]